VGVDAVVGPAGGGAAVQPVRAATARTEAASAEHARTRR
jgi:hypothetical protein